LTLSECKVTSKNKEFRDKETSKFSEIDLTSPEKTIFYFFEAFKTGNDKLLDIVLTPDASIPEFNPLQKIFEPNPYIIGVDINKIRFVKETKVYPDGFTITPSDIEVYVTIKYDKSFFKDQTMPDGHVAFLLRKIDNKWKIISMIPFWPEEMIKLRDSLE